MSYPFASFSQPFTSVLQPSNFSYSNLIHSVTHVEEDVIHKVMLVWKYSGKFPKNHKYGEVKNRVDKKKRQRN